MHSNTEVRIMEKARAEASFDSAQMAEIIYQCKSTSTLPAYLATNQRIESSKHLGSADNMKLPTIYSCTSREDLYKIGLKAGAITCEDEIQRGDNVHRYEAYDGKGGNSNPFGITFLLFEPFLRLAGSDEQIAKWGPPAERGEIVGCYAQTELGHGSFVGGIETTATLDEGTDEFIVHSPSITSAKYWPGSLGFSSTHSITMARLIIKGKDHGVHGFMMQIRSLEDGKPLAGIELGDIGMKVSYNGTCNGYAVFNNVRIPRTNLLMRHCYVCGCGMYTSVPLREKLLYGGMLSTRHMVVNSSALQLAQALTIAVRYSVVRTQGIDSHSKNLQEQPIINYNHQKHRLLTHLSRAYMTMFAYKETDNLYSKLKLQQAKGNHKMLPFMHMIMCGIKAWSSQTAAEGAEDARKLCGGHGYMCISGLPEIVSSIAAFCTLEGENMVMWSQVGTYLMKAQDGVLPPDMMYMKTVFPDQCTAKGEEFLNHDVILGMFYERAKFLASAGHQMVTASKVSGMTRGQAEKSNSLEILVASRAHIEAYILSTSIAHVKSLAKSPKPPSETILAVLQDIISLFGLSTIASPLAPFSSSWFASGHISQSHIMDMRNQVTALVDKLLPNAIALTDAWSFSDAKLASAIGCADGNIYERIMTWTRQLPMNVRASENGGVCQDAWDEISGFIQRGRQRGTSPSPSL